MNNIPPEDQNKRLKENPNKGTKAKWESIQRECEALERNLEESLRTQDELAKFLESKPFERKYYLGDVIGPIKLNFPIYGYKWTFFAGDINGELKAAESQFSEEDKQSAEYFDRLYEKVCQPGSKTKQFADFIMEFGVSFEDWYHLWKLNQLNSEARCPEKTMSLEEIAATSQQHLDQGVISADQHKAVVNLTNTYRAKGYKYINVIL